MDHTSCEEAVDVPHPVALTRKLRMDVYVDVLSGYTYVAVGVLKRYQPIWGMELNIYPVSLPKVISLSGNRPPMFNRAVSLYSNRDLPRAAQLAKLPFRGVPTNHPSVPLPKGVLPMASGSLNRLVIAVGQIFGANSEKTLSTLLAICEQVFVERHNQELVVTKDVLAGILQKAGLNELQATSTLLHTNSKAVQTQYDENTQRALQLGMFGAPYIVVHKPEALQPECFWGSDRLAALAFTMGLPYYGQHPEDYTAAKL